MEMNEMPSVCVRFSAPLNKTNEWKWKENGRKWKENGIYAAHQQMAFMEAPENI